MLTQFTNLFKSWKQVAIVALVVIYIAINLFHIGGDAFIISLNDSIVVPLAIGTTLFAWILWRQMNSASQNQSLWLGLAIGWTMWTIAEFWWVIAGFVDQELPYPSGADFFWLTGYIPLYFALWGRARSLPRNSSSTQRAGVWILSLLAVGLVILLVILPIIRDSDPSAVVENVITIFYPLADTILLVLVLQVFFSYQQGLYGQAWRWIVSGFILVALSDLLFAYAITNNLYYPEGQVNLLSTFGVSIPYNLSYLVWIIGLFLMQNLLKTYQPVTEDVKRLALVPNTHLLVFTKGDDTVTGVSRNYSQVYSDDAVDGKTVSEVLGLSPEVESAIFQKLRANSVLEEKPFRANTRMGQKEVFVSGIVAHINPQKEYFGVLLLVRVLVEEVYSLDNLLTDYEKGMVRSLLSKTGTEKKEQTEIKQLLADYYQVFLSTFYNRALSEGGSIFADAFITELQTVAEKQGWQVKILPNALDVSNLSISEVRKTLPLLLETARKFVGNLTSDEDVNTIVQETRSKFGDLALRNVSHVESAEGERT